MSHIRPVKSELHWNQVGRSLKVLMYPSRVAWIGSAIAAPWASRPWTRQFSQGDLWTAGSQGIIGRLSGHPLLDLSAEVLGQAGYAREIARNKPPAKPSSANPLTTWMGTRVNENNISQRVRMIVVITIGAETNLLKLSGDLVLGGP